MCEQTLFGGLASIPPTLFSDDLTDAVKEPSVARPEGALVVDHLHLANEEKHALVQTAAVTTKACYRVWLRPPSQFPSDTPPGWLRLCPLPNRTRDSACCPTGLWRRALGCSASRTCQTCEGQRGSFPAISTTPPNSFWLRLCLNTKRSICCPICRRGHYLTADLGMDP